ncbi:Homeobox protein HD-6 [Nosema bombycis CQ1]|uniref:Homeobox protein HD-6 n=1 Tax=Nosema bombycis (strain CQ1 / CVCC 102059) TaxID=578461 RepID=R0KSH3_NOSB1|nr:Homeobox protein HD-6 [Nosema bombycis CQ1]EOB13167.1 Homeobox protein HD-6 [Nosema bombycis CQ1]|eukprot:EOB12140.1 Homeobox protein HD-6 [Nosema bombycis CQ1]
MGKNIKKFKIIDVQNEIRSYYTLRPTPTRKKINLTDWQKKRLEVYFFINSYPNRMDCEMIKNEVNLPIKNIKIWFQNRRVKEKISIEERNKEGEGE